MQSSIAQALKTMILANKGKFFSVEFVKADGTLRKIVGQVGYKEGHDGVNTVAHIPKYITVVENLGGGKYQHRNVNTTTIKRLAVGGSVIEIK